MYTRIFLKTLIYSCDFKIKVEVQVFFLTFSQEVQTKLNFTGFVGSRLIRFTAAGVAVPTCPCDITSIRLAPRIYKVARDTDLFRTEDAYLRHPLRYETS